MGRLLATVDHSVTTDLISWQHSLYKQLLENPTADSYVHAHDSNSDSNSFSSAVNLTQQNQHIPVGPVQHHSLAAIATQIQQRLNYDLQCLLPSLHGLANLLSDASAQSMTPKLEEFSDLLSSMWVIIDHIMTQNETGPEAPIPSQCSDLPQVAT